MCVRLTQLRAGGCLRTGPHRHPAPIDGEAATALLRRAIGLGVNHIDTAVFYGSGEANRLIQEALHPYPTDLVLATKVGAETDAYGKLVAAQRPEQLRAGVEANLRTLAVDRIDVVNLRRLDAPPGILATGDQAVDLDSQLAELEALRDDQFTDERCSTPWSKAPVDGGIGRPVTRAAVRSSRGRTARV